jgi:hypothetical protein
LQGDVNVGRLVPSYDSHRLVSGLDGVSDGHLQFLEFSPAVLQIM